jgi:hypothetical protein
MAMTPEEMEAAILELQAQMATIASYPFMEYVQGESIGGTGPGTQRSGSTTQIWKNFDAIKRR